MGIRSMKFKANDIPITNEEVDENGDEKGFWEVTDINKPVWNFFEKHQNGFVQYLLDKSQNCEHLTKFSCSL